jgi:DNA invertase Pin-like site-specific DNA recombinase
MENMIQGINMTPAGSVPELTTTARYCLYARKSTEQDELQALSIDSQIKEMLAMAARDNLNVVEVRRESHSAKESGQRPVFNQLLQDIRVGMFTGLIAWDPSRISRNAGDLGSVVDLMDSKHLVDIRTHGQRFTNSPNEKFLLMILCSQAKLENDHKGENVRRGLRAKCEMGFRPGVSPLGYMQDSTQRKGQKRIIKDPERAHIIKEMFEKIANEDTSCRSLFVWLVERGVTTRNGKRVALSAIQRMMRDTFYYGEFEYPVGSGVWYQGAYEPIITKELFLAAQANLRVGQKRRLPGIKERDYSRMFLCGACGSGICAQDKYKQCKNGNVHHYVYYNCTRFKDKFCKQRPIREEEILRQLLELLDKLDIDEIGAKEQIMREVVKYRRLSHGVLGKETELDKGPIEADVRKYAKYVLEYGSREEKRELLSCLKSKISINDKVLSLTN